MATSFFWLLVFGVIFFSIWAQFRKIWPAMFFLFLVLLFFSNLIPPVALSLVELFLAFGLAQLIYKLIVSKVVD